MGDEKGSHLCGWFTISFPLQGMEKLHKPEAEITLRKNNSWLKLYRKLYMYKIDTWIAYTPTVQVLENFLKFNRWMLLEWNAASRELTTEGLMAEKGPILTSGIIFYLSIGAAIFQILEEPNWKTAVSDYGIKKEKLLQKYPCLSKDNLEEIVKVWLLNDVSKKFSLKFCFFNKLLQC